MKRAPANEPFLSHYTTNTGDRQDFAICAENYDPDVIAVVAEAVARGEQLGPWRWKAEAAIADGCWTFAVKQGDRTLSTNRASREGRGIYLDTTIVSPEAPDEASSMADFEQCVALALWRITPPPTGRRQ